MMIFAILAVAVSAVTIPSTEPYNAYDLQRETIQTVEKNRVNSINHSDFVDDIYPQMKRPLIILFGSNYCQYSRNQMKLLLKIANETEYYKYVDFYCVNADVEENADWLEMIYREEELEALGVPTWVIYYGTRGDGDDIGFSCAGNLTSEQICEEIERIIDWYDDAVGYPDDKEIEASEFFNSLLPKMTKPLVIDFWAEWCGPCRKYAPIFMNVATQYSDKAVFYRVNVDKNEEWCREWKIQSIPTTIIVYNKSGEYLKCEGLITDKELKQLIDEGIRRLQLDDEAYF